MCQVWVPALHAVFLYMTCANIKSLNYSLLYLHKAITRITSTHLLVSYWEFMFCHFSHFGIEIFMSARQCYPSSVSKLFFFLIYFPVFTSIYLFKLTSLQFENGEVWEYRMNSALLKDVLPNGLFPLFWNFFCSPWILNGVKIGSFKSISTLEWMGVGPGACLM